MYSNPTLRLLFDLNTKINRHQYLGGVSFIILCFALLFVAEFQFPLAGKGALSLEETGNYLGVLKLMRNFSSTLLFVTYIFTPIIFLGGLTLTVKRARSLGYSNGKSWLLGWLFYIACCSINLIENLGISLNNYSSDFGIMTDSEKLFGNIFGIFGCLLFLMGIVIVIILSKHGSPEIESRLSTKKYNAIRASIQSAWVCLAMLVFWFVSSMLVPMLYFKNIITIPSPISASLISTVLFVVIFGIIVLVKRTEDAGKKAIWISVLLGGYIVMVGLAYIPFLMANASPYSFRISIYSTQLLSIYSHIMTFIFVWLLILPSKKDVVDSRTIYKNPTLRLMFDSNEKISFQQYWGGLSIALICLIFTVGYQILFWFTQTTALVETPKFDISPNFAHGIIEGILKAFTTILYILPALLSFTAIIVTAKRALTVGYNTKKAWTMGIFSYLSFVALYGICLLGNMRYYPEALNRNFTLIISLGIVLFIFVAIGGYIAYRLSQLSLSKIDRVQFQIPAYDSIVANITTVKILLSVTALYFFLMVFVDAMNIATPADFTPTVITLFFLLTLIPFVVIKRVKNSGKSTTWVAVIIVLYLVALGLRVVPSMINFQPQSFGGYVFYLLSKDAPIYIGGIANFITLALLLLPSKKQ